MRGTRARRSRAARPRRAENRTTSRPAGRIGRRSLLRSWKHSGGWGRCVPVRGTRRAGWGLARSTGVGVGLANGGESVRERGDLAGLDGHARGDRARLVDAERAERPAERAVLGDGDFADDVTAVRTLHDAREWDQGERAAVEAREDAAGRRRAGEVARAARDR